MNEIIRKRWFILSGTKLSLLYRIKEYIMKMVATIVINVRGSRAILASQLQGIPSGVSANKNPFACLHIPATLIAD